ncbi:MAG: ABC transporter permease [Planctomycetota bacterium]
MDLPLTVLSDGPDRGSQVRLVGRLHLQDGPQAWRKLQEIQRDVASLRELDLTDLESLDGAGAAALLAMQTRADRIGPGFTLVGANPKVERLLSLYRQGAGAGALQDQPLCKPLFVQIGESAWEQLSSLRDLLASIGGFTAGTLRAIRDPRSIHTADIPRLIERAGADALPIILVIDGLVGMIISVTAADQLQRFGGNVFLPNMIGVAMIRELGPLMTAFVLAGRTGASYAAELGTMRVNEEVDAARVMGLDPTRFLVLPRLIALLFVTPILTILGTILGIVGGLFIGMTTLDVTPIVFWSRLHESVSTLDVVEGLTKAFVFSSAIGSIACHFGLQTRGGAAEVGRSTTRAVVTSLFLLVALDGVLTSGFQVLRSA